jgi:hypothetical protein
VEWCWLLNLPGAGGWYRESDVTKERIQKLLKAGANVIMTTKGIDDMALKVSAVWPFARGGQQFVECF